MVLVELRVHGGDLALAEGVVEHVVDGRTSAMPSRDAVSRSIDEVGLQALVLHVAGDVGELGMLAQLR